MLLRLFNIISAHQMHAYNLETNYWEEIVTKPHDKIGKFFTFGYNLVNRRIWSSPYGFNFSSQDILQLVDVTAVFRSKMVSRVSQHQLVTVTRFPSHSCRFCFYIQRCLYVEVIMAS